jgi:hypothetical protein
MASLTPNLQCSEDTTALHYQYSLLRVFPSPLAYAATQKFVASMLLPSAARQFGWPKIRQQVNARTTSNAKGHHQLERLRLWLITTEWRSQSRTRSHQSINYHIPGQQRRPSSASPPEQQNYVVCFKGMERTSTVW